MLNQDNESVARLGKWNFIKMRNVHFPHFPHMLKIVVSNLIGLAGDWEVAVPFLFDVDTVVRRRMYGANQVIENQWCGEDTL